MSTDTQHSQNLERRIEQLEERVAELESERELSAYRGDHRTAAVLEALDPGDAVSVRDFHTLYRRHTDLVDSDKIGDRIRSLVGRPIFESCGNRVWQYRPERGER